MKEKPAAPKPGNRSEVLDLLLYGPEGGINCPNAVRTEEGRGATPVHTSNDVY